MTTKKKATAPIEEQSETVQVTRRAPENAGEGSNFKNSALVNIDGKPVSVRADGGLNLRIGPGRGYSVAEVLEDGTLLKVLELPYGIEVPGWVLVHTGQRTGWVDCNFLQPLKTAKE